MKNEISWTIKATKQLRKLPQNRQKQIRDAVNGLAEFPENRSVHVKALKGHRFGYRLRVGDYRVLFSHWKVTKIVEVQEVKKRDDRTY